MESATRLQLKCKVFFSNWSNNSITYKIYVDKPTKSLIRDVCYPSTTLFKSKYTPCGCDHEHEATKQYQARICDIYENSMLLVLDSGLVLHPNYPSTGLQKCDCCGTVIVEIKCPYCKRNSKIDGVRDGELTLSKKHWKYYQGQCQLLFTEQEYCDFIVWTQADYFQERIQQTYKSKDF